MEASSEVFFHSLQYAGPDLIILQSAWEIWFVLVQIQRSRSWADCEMWIKSFKWNCFIEGNNLNASKMERLNMKEMFIEKIVLIAAYYCANENDFKMLYIYN